MESNWTSYYAATLDSQVFVPESFVARFFLSTRPVALDHDYTYDNKTVLDIGCGSGRHLHFFTQLGLRATGIDLSTSQVPVELAQRVTLLTGSLADLPDLREQFQFVTCVNSVYYCESESDLECHLRQINEKLEAGGYAVVSFVGDQHFVVDRTGNAYSHCYEAYTSPETHQCGSNKVLIPFSRSSIVELFSRAGFPSNAIQVGEVIDLFSGMSRHLYYVYAKKA